MFDFLQRQAVKAGQAFGVVTYVGPQKDFASSIHIITYNVDQIQERTVSAQEFSLTELPENSMRWVRVVGVHDTGLLERIGQSLHLPSMVLEDIADTTQRPKYEEGEDYIFMVVKVIGYDEEAKKLAVEQVSIAITQGVLATFQENERNVFDGVLERLRRGRHRSKLDPHYLFFSLLDAVVDRYVVALGVLGDHVEDVEETLLEIQTEEALMNIYGLKRETVFMRKQVWPLREVLLSLWRKRKSKHVSNESKAYLREVRDHISQVIETVDSLNDVLTGMLNVYVSVTDLRMNQIMKVLTVVATIFIPLTFVTSLYGMNFENMPELHWRWGYYIILGTMLGLALIMLAYFRIKKWL
ncbi:MAG: magnesium transporter [Desulfovibrionales bacterium]|nr:magnesium transporter [Desulfovibrionales bacterium]